ncbi:MAG: TonB-dependent receptor [Bacteroidota bacterium]
MKKITYIIIFLLFSYYIVNAQNQISGKITNHETNDALPVVNVYLLELHKGTVTNETGEYLLTNLPKGKFKVQYSFIGYKTVVKTVQLNDSISEIAINIQLEPAILETEQVVITGGYHSTQHENAVAIEVIKLEEITNSGTQSFTEALTNIPGIDMIAKGAGVSKPVIRGLSNTNILLLNNGVKMENFQFSENHPFIIDEFGIDKVEVIKGPASLLYGSDAIGGVLNIIKEKPAPGGKIIGDYNLQYHTNTNGAVTNLGIKGASKSFFWGLRGGMKSHEDYIDGNSDFVPNTRFNDQSYKLNAGFNKPFGSFKIYYDLNLMNLGMCVPEVFSLVTEKGRKNKYWYQDLSNHVISSKNTLFLGNFKIGANVACQFNNRQLQTVDLTAVNMDLNTLSYELKTYLPSNEKSEYIIGFQGANKQNRNNEAPNHVLPDFNVDDISFFGLAQYTFFNKLTAQAGLRYDYRNIFVPEQEKSVHFHEAEEEEHGEEHELMEELKSNYNNVSASMGATYQLNEKILFRANFASAYRTPNIAELTQDGMHGARYEQGSRDLTSQRSYETDISIHYCSKHTTFDFAIFDNQIKNYIFLAPTSDTTGSGIDIYRYSQTNAELYGGEAGIHIHPHLLHWLHFKSTFSYVIGTQEDNSYLPFIPAPKIRIELRAEKEKLAFLHKAFIKIGTLMAFDQENPAMFETESAGYALLNLGIGGSIKWTKQMISIGIYANNLLDEKYFDHLSTLKPMNVYNQGRNISVCVKVPFNIKK